MPTAEKGVILSIAGALTHPKLSITFKDVSFEKPAQSQSIHEKKKSLLSITTKFDCSFAGGGNTRDDRQDPDECGGGEEKAQRHPVRAPDR